MTNKPTELIKPIELIPSGCTVNGIMPHHVPGIDFPYSRDYGLDPFKCSATKCIANKDKLCIIPSLCEIGEDGHCKGYTEKKDNIGKRT